MPGPSAETALHVRNVRICELKLNTLVSNLHPSTIHSFILLFYFYTTHYYIMYKWIFLILLLFFGFYLFDSVGYSTIVCTYFCSTYHPTYYFWIHKDDILFSILLKGFLFYNTIYLFIKNSNPKIYEMGSHISDMLLFVILCRYPFGVRHHMNMIMYIIYRYIHL